MIYDLFTFNNEFDLLEIRLNELAGVVDRFVVCESSFTFTGKPEPLHLTKRLSEFAAFPVTIVVYEYQALKTARENEMAQRDHLITGVTGAATSDVILLSDVDEIPRRSILESMDSLDGVWGLEIDLSYYYVNCLTGAPWTHVKAFRVGRVDRPLSQMRFSYVDKAIPKAGNHFSYLGGAEVISDKLKSFAHTEYSGPEYSDPVRVQSRIDRRLNLFDDKQFLVVPLDEMELCPQYLKNNRERFSHLIAEVP